MIALIDNYDSFIYNIGRYIGQLGHKRLIFRNDDVDLSYLQKLCPSHIIISPGPCTPDQSGISMEVIHYFGERIPVLGICLGHQAIAQVFGGNIVRANHPMHGMSSRVSHNFQGILQNLPNPLRVGRYHSLVVDPHTLPDCLEVTAYSEEDEIMALQHKELPIFGVQFHPESILTEKGYELLKNFCQLSKEGMSTFGLTGIL